MGRAPRIDLAGHVYHVLNRANARQTLFHEDEDYIRFEKTLTEAVEIFDLPLLAYVVMPNHFHFVFYPALDNQIGQFMQWFTLTHTKRHHTSKDTTGYGHLYQGRYKSFITQSDNHTLRLIQYVERNPVGVNLVQNPLDWRYGSLYRRYRGTDKEKKILGAWPVDEPKDYLKHIGIPEKEDGLELLRKSITRGQPFGNAEWVLSIIKKYKLQSTTRSEGRPKKY